MMIMNKPVLKISLNIVSIAAHLCPCSSLSTYSPSLSLSSTSVCLSLSLSDLLVKADFSAIVSQCSSWGVVEFLLKTKPESVYNIE